MSVVTALWKENTEKIITVFGSEQAIVEAFWKKRGSSVAFQKITGEFSYKNDDVWELSTSFENGEYIIKSVVKEPDLTDDIVSIGYINVVTPEEYSHTIGHELIRQDIEEIIKKMYLKVSG